MDYLSLEFWLQILILVITITAGFVNIKNEIKYTNERIELLSKKQDKHNRLIERMTIVEQSSKSAHYRIDELKQKLG